MAALREPRRANLATIVGSSLAAVAAGSLLAFSTLAEQAGLEGLATGGLQPAVPGRTGTAGHAITVPAPPEDPRKALAELVRENVRRAPEPAPRPAVAIAPAEPPSPEKPERDRPRRIDTGARVAVVEPPVEEETHAAEPDGPPYGHAYGHYKDKKDKHKDKHDKHKDPKPAKKRGPKTGPSEQPVYARTANDDDGSKRYKPSKPAKLEKAKKAKKAESNGNVKAKGHSKHAGNGKANDRSPGRSAGKAKGHSKHAHKGKAKGKGHSKHGG